MQTPNNTILRLAIPSPLRRLFDYLPPKAEWNYRPEEGTRYQVNFGNRQVVGILVEIASHSEVPANKLKSATKRLDDTPVLSSALFKLCRWTSQYYQHSLGDVFSQAVPTLLRQGHAATLSTEKRWLPTRKGELIDAAQLGRARKQVEALKVLQEHPKGLSNKMLETHGIQRSILNALAKKDLAIQIDSKPELELFAPSTSNPLAESPLTLNEEQRVAVEAIKLDAFNPYLLDGVTGSGKTEVYLQAIEKVLIAGQQALLLVPEIGLTPQTINRIKHRFNCTICTFHSGLSDKERLNNWLKAKQGIARIIIGTRSAIFTPMADPGLIIIDEEHDSAFKQQDSLRYSARDLALVRGKTENIPVILGSATPALESIHNAIHKRYTWLKLTQRAGDAQPPQMHTLDISNATLKGGLSETLISAIHTHLNAGNQILLFLNRRGFAPTLLCHDCGWLASCKRCDARYTYHKRNHNLQCHHCGDMRRLPKQCGDCGSTDLRDIGVGTEKLEEHLKQLFTKFPVLRIDRDSTRRKNSMNELLSEINQGNPAILVGTQMLAKGHHFPHVTLVGMTDIDSGFLSADFRAAEKMAQLIVQVSGRAGRASKLGTVLLQTHFPDSLLVQTLIHSGYTTFAEQTLRERELAEFPPFGHLSMIRAEAHQQGLAQAFLAEVQHLAEDYKQQLNFNTPHVLGPAPAPMEKRGGRYRMQLLLQSSKRQSLHQLMNNLIPAIEGLKSSRKVRWSIDVDPLDLY